MELLGRTLSMDMRGADVALLHKKLKQLGVALPNDEVQKELFGEGTVRAAREFQKRQGLTITGVVDESTGLALEEAIEKGRREFRVQGRVQVADGKTVAGKVLVYDGDLRGHKQFLGKGDIKTEEDGYFEINYKRENFGRPQKRSANLLFEVEDKRGNKIKDFQLLRVLNGTSAPVEEPPIIFRASAEESVEIVVGAEAYRGPSEYQRLLDAILPIVTARRVEIPDLKEDKDQPDITFLAKETGEEPQRISFLVQAHRLARDEKLPKELPAEVLYGLFRQDLPTSLPALAARDPDLLRGALWSASRENIIGSQWGEDKASEGALAELREAYVKHALKKGADKQTTLGDLLETTSANEALRHKFAAAYLSHAGSLEDFWKMLNEDARFSDLRDHADDLRFTVEIATLTANHLPLIKHLKGNHKSLRELVRYDREEWKKIISARDARIGFPPDVPGDDPEARASNYAEMLARRVEDMFPNEFVAHSLIKDQRPDEEHLQTFLRNNVLEADPEKRFDLATTRLEEYLKGNPNALKDIPAQKRPEVKDQVKRIQRLWRVTPRHAHMRELEKAKYHSAYAITRKGRKAFVNEISAKLHGDLDGKLQAKIYYERARSIKATTLMLFGELKSTLNAPQMRALSNTTAEQIKQIPDLETLFGSMDLCECEHCRSVYSPAAYLVDILYFLKDRHKKAGKSPKDVLFERRPDLGEIELSCENTNTPLPYIDLANEVLEDAISPAAGFQPFDLDLARESDLKARVVSQGLKGDFRNQNHELSEFAVINVKQEGKWWTIDEPRHTYTVYKVKDPNNTNHIRVLFRGRQTSGTAQERRANPQYLNAGAYEKLRREVYPWNVPFDLWEKEARVYLDHLGVSHYAIAEPFSPHKTREEILDDVEIGSLYLGLTPVERQIIVGDPVTVGEPVRVATTTSLQSRSGVFNIDGVRVADGDRVLVKNQANQAENGLYTVRTGAWSRNEILAGTSLHVTVQEGTTNKNKHFRLDRDDQGVWISDCSRAVFWGLTDNVWPDALTTVETFLRQSGLGDPIKPETGYNELLELLDTRFINGDRNISIQPVVGAPAYTCALGELEFHFDDPGKKAETWDKLHRFVRLARALKWRYYELDRALTAFGSAVLDGAIIVKLAHLKRLRKALDVPIEAVLSWWANLDTAEYTDHSAPGRPKVASPYERLFLNPAVINPLDSTFKLNSARDELSDTTVKISDHSAAITSALRISAADLSLMLTEQVPDPANRQNLRPLVEDKLKLENLSQLYQVTSLAKALRLSIRDLVRLLKLSENNLFDVADTGKAVLLVEEAEEVRNSGFSVAELNYLLRHEFDPTLALAPREEDIAVVLDEVRSGLRQIAEENTFSDATSDPDGELTRKKLALLNWDAAVVDEAIAMLNGSAVYTVSDPRTFVRRNMRTFEVLTFGANLDQLPPGLQFPLELQSKISYDDATKQLRYVGAMTTEDRDLLKGLDAAQKYKDAIDELFNLSRPTPPNEFLTNSDAQALFDQPRSAEERFKHVLQKLLPYLQSTLSRNFAVQKIGDVLKLEAATASQLLEGLKSKSDSALSCLDDFLDKAFVDSAPSIELSAEPFSRQFRVFNLLHKAATVITRFKITLVQLEWLFDYGAGAGWLDLNTLPTKAAESQPDALAGWSRLVDLFEVRDRLAGGESALDELLRSGNKVGPAASDADKNQAKQEYIETLATWTLWSEQDLDTLLGKKNDHTQNGTLNVTFPDDYKDEGILLRLLDCFAVIKRLGVSAEQCQALSKPGLNEGDARSVKQAVKAKYDEKEWLDRAGSLRDVLREKQRDALVDYLATHPYTGDGGTPLWEDKNDLYAYFLIDVEMSACQGTSRIKQAVGSAQLFVQRCLMNLEAGVSADAEVDDNWKHWKWMKNYRVWEANRKVFLYPENWLEPELRDDKSPFFKELENELLQNEVTDETAETAFLHYLEKLDQVARLDIVGMFHQREGDSGNPSQTDVLHVFGRTYSKPHLYYYRRREKSVWTPWKKVDLDIEGDHLIPVIWNRRLYLFWPVFVEKVENPEEANGTEKPNRYWEIQLAWSEYRNGAWSPKKVSAPYEHPLVAYLR